MLSVDGYVKKYGFCNWQAQEVIKQRDAAADTLKLTAKFFEMRLQELGCLSTEAQDLYDRVCAAIAVCEARGL